MYEGCEGLRAWLNLPLKHRSVRSLAAQNKDEFHLYYRKYLMKRLLQKGSSYNEEREQNMIRKLRVCVYLYG